MMPEGVGCPAVILRGSRGKCAALRSAALVTKRKIMVILRIVLCIPYLTIVRVVR